jgi:hypothetical protein
MVNPVNNCGFTDIYGYQPITLVIVDNYGFQTDIYSYWSMTMDIGLIVQTAFHI